MSPREHMLEMVRRIQIAPAAYAALLRGVALKRHLSDVTGLSHTRIANGVQNLRPNRLRQVEQHAAAVLTGNLLNAGLTPEDAHLHLNQRRSLAERGGAGWATFWIELDYPIEPEFAACVETGLAIDLLLAGLAQAAEHDQLSGASAAGLAFIEAQKLPIEIVAYRPGMQAGSWLDVASWDGVCRLSEDLLLTAYFDQLAHFDAEWGSSFFSRFEPRSILLLVAPQLRDPMRLDTPVRRLLVLAWSICHWARHRRWPSQPPGPSDIAEAVGLEPPHVSNFFDGTRKLRLGHFANLWDQMGKHFRLQHPVPCPIPLAAIAICWQRQFVTLGGGQKSKSIILIGDEFVRVWRWRMGQLHHRVASESWPCWMTS